MAVAPDSTRTRPLHSFVAGVALPRVSLAWLLLILVLVVSIAAGLFARLDGLGSRSLAEDEYYWVKSIEFILEHGVPEFPTGGYYLRSAPQQYLTAAMAQLFGDSALIHRLPPTIFSLLSVVLAYLYAGRFVSRPVAVAVAVALLISSWQIEFARFARMYMLFQVMTLLFLIALDDAFFRRRWERRYLPHGLLVLTTLTHNVGVLFTPLLFLPFLTSARTGPLAGWRPRITFAAAGLLTTVVCVATTVFDWRNLGVDTPRLPDDYVRPPGVDPGSGLEMPAFPFWELAGDPMMTLAAVVLGAGLLMAALLALRWRGAPVRDTDILLAALIVLSVTHLFVLAGIVLLILLLRYDLYRIDRHPPRTYVLLLLALAIGVGWLAYALADPQKLWVPEVTRRWDMTRAGDLKALWTAFFGWPDLYPLVIRPLALELPEVGLLTAGALLYAAWSRRHAPLPEVLRHPGFVVVYSFLCFGVVTTNWSLLRYMFHLYPVILCLIAMAVCEITVRAAGVLRARGGRTLPGVRPDMAAAFGFLTLFAATSDFNPRHIGQVSDPELAWRLGEFERFQNTWYPRWDTESPAHFVNRVAVPDERTRVVVETRPEVSYYLDGEHAIYFVRESIHYQEISRERGTRDLWSNMPLLGTPAELADYTRSAREVWLIRRSEPEARYPLAPEPEEVWGERLVGWEQAFVSRDGRVEVLRIRLAPAAEDETAATEGAASGERLAHRLDDHRLGPGDKAGTHRRAQDLR